MPQTVPSAGFTPPCDYSTFPENFDLSLLPGGDQPISPSTQFYTQLPLSFKVTQPKIYTTFHSDKEADSDIELAPDFSTLLVQDDKKLAQSPIYLEVPSPRSFPNSPVGALSPCSPQSQGLLSPNDQFHTYRENYLYPSSPEHSLYTPSPSSVYSTSPCDDYIIKKEYSNSTSPLPNFSPFRIKEEAYQPSASPEQQLSLCIDDTDVLELFDNPPQDKQIKQESTVDFSNILEEFPDTDTLRQLLEKDIKTVPEKPKDHQLLREALKDTSFQKKFNIKPFDFGFLESDIKMEEPEQNDLLRTCNEQIARENIEPVLNLAMEQMRQDVDNTCATLGISTGMKFCNIL